MNVRRLVASAALCLVAGLAATASAQGVQLADRRPYAKTAPALTKALAALGGEGDRQAVLAGLESLIAAEARDPHLARVAISLRARLRLAAGDVDGAVSDLDALVARRSALAENLRDPVAKALKGRGDVAQAARVLVNARTVDSEFRDRLRRGVTMLRALKQPKEAAAAVRLATLQPMAAWRRARLGILEAELWVEAGERDQALAVLRRLWWDFASGRTGERARRELDKLGAGPTQVDEVARRVLSVRGASSGERMIEWLAQAKGLQPELKAWAEATVAAIVGDDREAALARYEELLPTLGAVEGLEPWQLFGHAIALRRLDRDVEAAGRYRELADRFPTHALAVRALVEAGGLLDRRGSPADAERLFARAAAVEIRSDDHAHALWEVGFRAILEGRPGAAIGPLAALEGIYGGDSDGLGLTWGERAGYWRARAEELSGLLDGAGLHYRQIALRYPASWYALLARDRLRDAAGAVTDTFVDTGVTVASRGLPGRPRVDRTLLRPELDSALLAWRTGDTRRAESRLDLLLDNRHLPGNGRALLARLYEARGDKDAAARLLRRRGVIAELPGSRDRKQWKEAYPLRFKGVIRSLSKRHKVPPSVLAALVHIESRFNPRARSGPGAVGLTQLMPRTAAAVGRHLLGIAVTARRLRRPRTNLLVGARFLRELLEHFGMNPALALAGYNAGHGAVRGWLRQRQHLQTDAFVETMPYDQARNYVRRVVSVAQVYRALHGLGGDQLRVPRELPLTLGPFFEEKRR